MADVLVRVAGTGDASAIALLRALFLDAPSNMFVREEARDTGIGTALLDALIEAAEERGYARLVLSPAERAIPFYRRAGFAVPAGDHRLLVRPAGVAAGASSG